MTLDGIRELCRSFPGVTEDIKWEDHLCFNVGEKMFLITSPDRIPVNASFKTSEEKFEELTEREGFHAAPYLGRNKWIQVDDIGLLSAREGKELLSLSYAIIRAGLPKSKRP